MYFREGGTPNLTIDLKSGQIHNFVSGFKNLLYSRKNKLLISNSPTKLTNLKLIKIYF